VPKNPNPYSKLVNPLYLFNIMVLLTGGDP